VASSFQATYLAGAPPWDIGRPQGIFVHLVDAGAVRGRVIDLGCGTGENALYASAHGLDVMGVDLAPEAIRQARAKAQERGAAVDFRVADVLELNGYGGTFDAAIDSGMFHTLRETDRPRYASSVHGALRPGGRLFIACFSEHEPGDWGPRRVTQAEIHETFRDGWTVDSIEAAVFDTTLAEASKVSAWLASLTSR